MDKCGETESKSDTDNPGSAKSDADNPGSAKSDADNSGGTKSDADNPGSTKSDTDNSDTECNACPNTAADRTTDGSTGRGRERNSSERQSGSDFQGNECGFGKSGSAV